MEALGGNPHDGAKVVAKMKEMPTDDPLFGKGPLRVDGRRIIPAYLFEVKKPEESKYPWDYYKLIATISPEDAAKPLESQRVPAGEEVIVGNWPDPQRSGRFQPQQLRLVELVIQTGADDVVGHVKRIG